MLVDFVFIGDLLSLVLLIIMAFGSVAVVSFVYVEMWEDKEGANFVILLVAFLAFMGVLAASGNVLVFYLGWEGIGLVSLFLINFWSERPVWMSELVEPGLPWLVCAGLTVVVDCGLRWLLGLVWGVVGQPCIHFVCGQLS